MSVRLLFFFGKHGLSYILINCLTDFMCPLGHNESDVFKKIKNTDPLMGAKFKSKTHLLDRFFDFWRRMENLFL